MEKKTIGVLTSGGDAPGMNAAVRAVVRSAIQKGFNVVGIKRGYNGLINGDDIVPMDLRSVSNIIKLGGTVLYTARCAEFREWEGVLRAKETCIKHNMAGIVVIGGDGSFRGAADLSKAGIPCVGVPGTIDNDITCSEYTIGYDTAMNTAVDMVDRLRDTARSHDRCNVVEVMGRHCGDIALNVGIACGATYIVVPELGLDMNDVVEKVKTAAALNRHHFIIMVAEGIGKSDEICQAIEKATGIESRATILGHVQRGGCPTLRDRVVASQMGHYAVDLLSKGIGNRVVAMKASKIVDFDIQEALSITKSFDRELYDIAQDISS